MHAGRVGDSEGLPPTAARQSCAFCGDDRPTWVHPLDPRAVRFAVHGKPHTLPTFWCVCNRCEGLLSLGEDAELLTLMGASGGHDPSVQEWTPALTKARLEPALATFRQADLGSRPLPPADYRCRVAAPGDRDLLGRHVRPRIRASGA